MVTNYRILSFKLNLGNLSCSGLCFSLSPEGEWERLHTDNATSVPSLAARCSLPYKGQCIPASMTAGTVVAYAWPLVKGMLAAAAAATPAVLSSAWARTLSGWTRRLCSTQWSQCSSHMAHSCRCCLANSPALSLHCLIEVGRMVPDSRVLSGWVIQEFRASFSPEVSMADIKVKSLPLELPHKPQKVSYHQFTTPLSLVFKLSVICCLLYFLDY